MSENSIPTDAQASSSSHSNNKNRKGKRAQRNSSRRDNMRETKSIDFDTQNKKLIYDKLYFGFRQQVDAMKSLQIITTPSSVILPVTTRAVGFLTRSIAAKFARLGLRNLEIHPFCSALYRITLLQFEHKLSCAMQNAVSQNLGSGFDDIFISYDATQALGKLGSYFSPLINLISSIGIVHAFGTVYIPRLGLQSVDGAIRQFDPTLVSFSRLREYVVVLSAQGTAPHIRNYFYEHSPFPNAIWDRREDRDGLANPILMNPNDIMPAEYTYLQMVEDTNRIVDTIETVGRKFEKFIHVGGIDYFTKGNWSQLVSNGVEDIRCRDLRIADGVINYSMYSPLTGGINQFWSSEMLSDPEFFVGAMHLLGEMPKITTPIYNVRSVEVGKQRSQISYEAIVATMLG